MCGAHHLLLVKLKVHVVSVCLLRLQIMSFSIPEHIKAELRGLDVQRECPICLEVIRKGEVDVTDCGHYFCVSCLAAASNICPTCRSCHRRVGRIRRKTTTTTTTTTTTVTEDIFEDGQYEVVRGDIYFIRSNGYCYSLDPETLSMPHTFLGIISPDRRTIRKNVVEQM